MSVELEPQVRITERHFEEAASAAAAAAAAYKILDRLPDGLIYHRKEHTEKHVVPPAALNLAKRGKLPESERWLAGIEAAFHDVGFISQYNWNETMGASCAVEHMMYGSGLYTPKQMVIVHSAILNTDMKKDPPTRVAKVLRDADLSRAH